MNFEQFTQGDKQIFLVDMRKERSYPFSELVDKGLARAFKNNQRVLIINNKKGYSSGSICQDCGHVPECKACSVPIAYHKDQAGRYFGICHICKSQYAGPGTCEQCGGHDVENYGMGSQQLAEHIHAIYNVDALVVESSKVNSPKKAQKLLPEIRKSRCVVGTSLLTTPLPSAPFDLVVVPLADMGINYPDYQSNRYNFLILYELISKHPTQHYLIQSYHPEHYAILNACKGDLASMQQAELAYRKQHDYPPYTDMCIIRFKHEVEERLYNGVNKLHQELLFCKEKYEMDELEIFTTPPLIYKIYHKYRYNIILKGPHLRQFVDIIYSKLKLASRGFKVDRQPESITG